mmetsp:Transcript_446/g.976  ORF Transcript_446/g.976 Transcript_446/m.976 type:complete len:340 (+) Transcript_446:239-1258(+)
MATIERYAVGGGGDDNVKKTEAELDEEAKARTEKMRIAVGCLLSYFGLGWIAYCAVFEKWSFTDATYFLMVTLTTVGYGDITPTTQASRLFTMFFVIFGISIVAVALVEVANFFMEKREELIKSTRTEVIKKAAANDGGVAEESEAADSPYAKFKEFLAAHPTVGLILNLGMYCLIAGGIFVWIEGWNMADSIYFTMITGTTVGFGDISPQTPQGRWFAVFFLPFAVIFVSTQLSSLANILLGKTEDTKVKALMSVDLSLEALLNMDTDGDGTITEFEFMKFMMVTAGMADEETLDSLHKRFEEMDADGSGALTREDIELILEEKKKAEAAAEAEEDGE